MMSWLPLMQFRDRSVPKHDNLRRAAEGLSRRAAAVALGVGDGP
jgi:hypothetical protein